MRLSSPCDHLSSTRRASSLSFCELFAEQTKEDEAVVKTMQGEAKLTCHTNYTWQALLSVVDVSN